MWADDLTLHPSVWALAGAAGCRQGTEGIDDATLIERFLRTDDDGLFEELVRRYQLRVFRFVLSLLGPGHESSAEDLTQEVFVQVYRKLSSFRGDCSFATWLFRIATNRVTDWRRRARQRPPRLPDDVLVTTPVTGADADPSARARTDQDRRRLLTHLVELPEVMRAVVYLYYWLDCPVAEISQLLQLNPETVKSHLYRARQRLAKKLRKDR